MDNKKEKEVVVDNRESLDWAIIDSYFKTTEHFFTKHHLDSFHEFIYESIPYTISTLNPIQTLKKDESGNLQYEINVYVGGRDGRETFLAKPTLFEDGTHRPLYPNEARLRDITYASDLFVNVLVEYIDFTDGRGKKTERKFEMVQIASIPILLHSRICALYEQPSTILKELGECPYDQGGYFIINGKEKVIIAQERMVTNRLFTGKSKLPEFSHEALIRFTSAENSLFPKTVRFGVYSREYRKGARNRSIILTCPNIENLNIPIFVVFRALGIESDRDIIQYILGGTIDKSNEAIVDFLRMSVVDGSFIYTQEEALSYLSGFTRYKTSEHVRYILEQDFFSNVGADFDHKAKCLGSTVKSIIYNVLGIVADTDRDNYLFKRIDLSGFMLANLFRDMYNKLRNHIRNNVDRQYHYGSWKSTKDITDLVNDDNIGFLFSKQIMVDGIIKSMKGNWGVTNDPADQGKVQDLNRLSYMGYVSHVRRVNTPVGGSVKLVGPHRLNGSHWGMVCPADSPDGASIGLTKHFTVMTMITSSVDMSVLQPYLIKYGMRNLGDVPATSAGRSCRVLLNDTWVGNHESPYELMTNLKRDRRQGSIPWTVGLSWKILNNEISIRCDSGRACRPVYIVGEKNELLVDKYEKQLRNLSWKDLLPGTKSLPECVVEYIDVEETNVCLIAMTRAYLKDSLKTYTHCEIHPSTVLSVYTNTIPFANHNAAPRNVFSAAQGKQAIGVYATNFNHRIDTASYILHYPQKALLHTRYSEYSNTDILPNGENLIVAVMTYTGYNMEDSIMVNRSSVERGMFNITVYKSHVDEEKSNHSGGERVIFCHPEELEKRGENMIKSGDAKNYQYLDADGFPKVNSQIHEGDVYLGKCNMKKSMVEGMMDEYRDVSEKGDKTFTGTIDKVFVSRNEDGNRRVKMRLRKMRKPELGDKMASRMGQKGICGMLLPQEAMPFTKEGVVPDIIINPHAFPSRMTIAHLLESVLGKLCCKAGVRVDGTIFRDHNLETLYDKMEDYDMDRHGNDILYNGRTGEQIPCSIFFGPTYYFRLKHMVADKVNYRSTGAKTATTRQPIKGRSRGGGLRIGEMETNALLGHGIAGFIKESMMVRADDYKTHVENNGGSLAISNPKLGLWKSGPNETTTSISAVAMPYAFKMMMQEVEAFGIKPRIQTSQTDPTRWVGDGEDDKDEEWRKIVLDAAEEREAQEKAELEQQEDEN